ncbi:hypothetical protein COCSADRAFT_77110 [Bipolaris sorokiniana ND90Pr]|uniref:Uncharacterized protein n=1 Tax=Cochliobolus sativus (strain ND90Pr / ATCC 201652) TaxID=665912 RepID=M2TIE9_COCSN|nr:uncharacterized protein COCSADRAFT_77110 [Bipolaris sorokiniana ND90Pr]EMD68996.1 hypothetical protein COCSADRAFT_77110 [Bipolaris sorokiniana ND90Pr]
MLLFSAPPCDSLLPRGPAKQTVSKRLALPFWSTTPASIPLLPRTPKKKASRPPPPQGRGKQSALQTKPTQMSHHADSSRSSTFAPTLGSIPEVFEYDPLDARHRPASLNDVPETPDAFLPEASIASPPALTRATSWPAIIQAPSRRVASSLAVSKALRRILEADRARRRRIMKAYLKAIVFLKYLWHANERYGHVMATTGMYMQR